MLESLNAQPLQRPQRQPVIVEFMLPNGLPWRCHRQRQPECQCLKYDPWVSCSESGEAVAVPLVHLICLAFAARAYPIAIDGDVLYQCWLQGGQCPNSTAQSRVQRCQPDGLVAGQLAHDDVQDNPGKLMKRARCRGPRRTVSGSTGA